jgi:hypothetical protein
VARKAIELFNAFVGAGFKYEELFPPPPKPEAQKPEAAKPAESAKPAEAKREAVKPEVGPQAVKPEAPRPLSLPLRLGRRPRSRLWRVLAAV